MARTFNFIATIFLLFLYTQVYAQVHEPVFPDLEGQLLLDQLANEYTTSTVLDYGEARDIMYGTIYKVDDSVSCVYSDHTLYLPPDVDPSSHLYMNGSANGINAEHTYPRSKGADEDDGNGNAFSDLHHLYPTRTAVNSARASFPFLEIIDDQTTSWFYLDQEESATPSNNIAFYSEQIDGVFEPREDHKGNVARAIFYFYTIYKDNADAADPDFFETQRETLCGWHNQDAVDALEYDRTYMIAGYQDDLPNPFILDYTLAHRSYCQEFPLPVALSDFKVFVNEGMAELNWETASEMNNSRFEIERRSSNHSWEVISYVNGRGTTSLTQNYSFIDENPFAGENYYRLKQVDFNGDFEYSRIRSVNINRGDHNFVKVYPNPSVGTFNMSLPSLNNQKIQIRLFDNIGNQLWAKIFEEDEASKPWEEEFHFPLQGMYFLVSQVDGAIYTQKIIIQN